MASPKPSRVKQVLIICNVWVHTKKEGYVTRPAAHSHYILHYMGCVSRGAICNNPQSNVGSKALQLEAQDPRARAS